MVSIQNIIGKNNVTQICNLNHYKLCVGEIT